MNPFAHPKNNPGSSSPTLSPRRVAGFLALVFALPLSAADAPKEGPADAPATAASFKKDKVDDAMKRAIDYIVSQQNKDQHFINDRGDTNRVAMTSLSIMAMAAVGHQPTDPTTEGRAMRSALAFILKDDNQDPQGYFGLKDGSRMYGHGITTLMLTEMLGMGLDVEQDKLTREKTQKAIELILKAQKIQKDPTRQGGWRYTPDAGDADLSVSVWQTMALRSAKNSGLDVPADAIKKAVDYLRKSYRSQLDAQGNPIDKVSGFTYEPGGGEQVFAPTAAGLLAMQVCGQYDDPRVAGAAEWLAQHPPKWEDRFFFYGTYYYAQGMYQRGGDLADQARKHTEETLLPHQTKEGYWESADGTENNAGRVYATTMAVLSLSVKYHYLPIYQR
jgi:hypothetical protein